MNKLEELIQELCSSGVVYKKMIDLGSFLGGLTGKKKEDFANGNSKFISYMNVYKNEALCLDIEEMVMIHDGEKQRRLEYCDVIFTGSSENKEECALSSVVVDYPKENYYLNSFCFIYRLNDSSIFNPHFLKHLFRSEKIREQLIATANGVTRFNVSKKKMEDVEIPVPPLQVQNEIVRILDNFTELTEELTEELTARKNQYEFYRNELLVNCDGKKYFLDELFDVKGGYTPSKENFEFWNNGAIPWFRLEDINDKGRVLTDAYQYVNKIALKKNGPFRANSVIITTSATIGEYALVKVPFICNQRFSVISLKDKFSNNVDMKFIMHYCWLLSAYCRANLNQGNFASVDMGKFKKFEFVVPSLEEQQLIVDILDKFDSYCNDISQSLPAEIEMRKKQYEYYREKLLTFKRLET